MPLLSCFENLCPQFLIPTTCSTASQFSQVYKHSNSLISFGNRCILINLCPQFFDTYDLLHCFAVLASLQAFEFADFLRKSLHSHSCTVSKVKNIFVQARTVLTLETLYQKNNVPWQKPGDEKFSAVPLL